MKPNLGNRNRGSAQRSGPIRTMSGSCSHDTQNFKVLHESRKTEEHPPIDTKDLLISGGLSSERV